MPAKSTKTTLSTIIEQLSQKTGGDFAEDINSPLGSLAKSELAKAIHDSEIRIDNLKQVLAGLLQKQQELEQLFLLAKSELEENRPKNPDKVIGPMEALYEKTPDQIAQLKQQLLDSFKNLQTLFNSLQQLNNFDPVAINYLSKVNAPAATKNTTTLNNIMQSKNFKQLAPNLTNQQQKLLVQRYNNLANNAVTALEVEARYKSSLKQAGIEDDRDFKPTDDSPEAKKVAEQKTVRRKSLANVMQQEFSLVTFIANIFAKEAPGKSFSLILLQANSFVKSSMFSMDLQDKIQQVMDNYDEKLVNEAANDLANAQSDHSENLVMKLHMVRSVVKEIDEEVEKTLQIAQEIGEEQDSVAKFLRGFITQLSLGTAARESKEDFSSPIAAKDTVNPKLSR